MTAAVHPGDALSRGERLTYILVLGALTALGPFTIDMYLPALPDLEREFHATPAAVQLTITATMLGFAAGQLVVGPLSDKVGRRRPLIAAAAVHVLACVAAALAPDLFWLSVARVFQGIGAASGAVVTMATVRDLFGGYPLVKMLSRLSLVSGLAPVLAPVIGSQLLLLVDWRGLFAFLACYGALMLVSTSLFVRETLPPERRAEKGSSTVAQRYGALFRDRIFVGAILIGGANFSGVFTYIASSSFLFQGVYDLNPQEYGLLFGVNSIGIMVGVQTSARLQKHINPPYVIAGATLMQFLAAVAIIVSELAGGGILGIAIPLWFFIAGCGFNFSAIPGLALSRHGRQAGTAASVLGAANFGFAGVVSPIVGLFAITNAIPMAGIMAIAIGLGMLVLWAVVRPRTVPPLGS